MSLLKPNVGTETEIDQIRRCLMPAAFAVAAAPRRSRVRRGSRAGVMTELSGALLEGVVDRLTRPELPGVRGAASLVWLLRAAGSTERGRRGVRWLWRAPRGVVDGW